MKVHPAAEVFPMMTDDELDQLAQDIKENGQLNPVIMDGDVLIDGRNRVAACERAGIDVEVEELGDREIEAVILSANVSRRHLTVGQRAMGAVLVKARIAKNGNSRRRTGERRAAFLAAGVSAGSLGNAEYVYKHAPDLVNQVMAGASLTEARRIAQELRKEKEDADEQAKRQLKEIEREQKRIAREEQKLLAALESIRSEIGPEVQVPPEPEMELRFTPHPSTGQIEMSSGPIHKSTLKDEQRLLKRLLAVRDTIEALAQEPVIESSQSFELHAMAVRDWASQVVKAVYGMVEAHNAVLKQSGKIRRVQ